MQNAYYHIHSGLSQLAAAPASPVETQKKKRVPASRTGNLSPMPCTAYPR